MGKSLSKGNCGKLVIEQAISHLSLNFRQKFVCLKVFGSNEQYTLEEWKQLLVKKEII